MKREKIIRLCNILASVALLLAPIISDSCRAWWYQPEEPEGFGVFAKDVKEGKRNGNCEG